MTSPVGGGGGKQKWHIVTLGGGLVQVTHRFSIKKYGFFSLHFFIKYNSRVSYHRDESYTYINNFHNVEMFFFFPLCTWFYSSSFSKIIFFRKVEQKLIYTFCRKKNPENSLKTMHMGIFGHNFRVWTSTKHRPILYENNEKSFVFLIKWGKSYSSTRNQKITGICGTVVA